VTTALANKRSSQQRKISEKQNDQWMLEMR